jgi:hypothetical protein
MVENYGPMVQKINNIGVNMKNNITFPYEKYKGTDIWNFLEKGINTLVNNKDIIEKTNRDYIVGYLCKIIIEKKLENS